MMNDSRSASCPLGVGVEEVAFLERSVEGEVRGVVAGAGEGLHGLAEPTVPQLLCLVFGRSSSLLQNANFSAHWDWLLNLASAVPVLRIRRGVIWDGQRDCFTLFVELLDGWNGGATSLSSVLRRLPFDALVAVRALARLFAH